VLALYRAWRVAREDSGGIALPTGRRILLPTEEVRDFFHDRANHFAELETVAEAMGREIGAGPAELNFAIAERLRRHHGLAVTFGPLPGRAAPLRPGGAALGSFGQPAAPEPGLPARLPVGADGGARRGGGGGQRGRALDGRRRG
jgi:hypothetical protein